MAKEVHGYIKTILVICAIVFAGGGYAMQIKANANTGKKNAADLDKVELKIESVKDTVHIVQLSAKDTQALAASAAAASQKSVEMFEKIQRQLEDRSKVDAAMQLDIREIQVQIKTLIPTKD